MWNLFDYVAEGVGATSYIVTFKNIQSDVVTFTEKVDKTKPSPVENTVDMNE